MLLFRILLAAATIVALVIVYFFVIGVADGSVSSFNIGLWLAILGITAGALVGGVMLNASGRRALADLVLAVLAVPGLAFGLFVLMMLIMQPRWN